MRASVKKGIALATVVLLVLPAAGCGTTSSTEVGVRTSLFGIFEKRGAQEVYQPGGVYFFLPFVNSWTTLPTNQQNLLMTLNSREGDLPVRDDITFKTKDGNNVYIDVNVMWRVDPSKAGTVISLVGQSVDEIKERIVRPMALPPASQRGPCSCQSARAQSVAMPESSSAAPKPETSSSGPSCTTSAFSASISCTAPVLIIWMRSRVDRWPSMTRT